MSAAQFNLKHDLISFILIKLLPICKFTRPAGRRRFKVTAQNASRSPGINLNAAQLLHRRTAPCPLR